ncbi:MAG TPA: DUF885 domain-containing protein [Thermoanaerobaculia bacterium]|nr:DUF885 domain-containing protein [Thermoanaerobaculia bacterium]
MIRTRLLIPVSLLCLFSGAARGTVVSAAPPTSAKAQPTPAAAPASDPSARPPEKAWIAASNKYADELIQVAFKHHPEAASAQGLAQFDTKASQPTLADENAERQETEAVLARLKTALSQKQQKEVAEDLQIMIRRTELTFRQQDFYRAHEVPFFNASSGVFGGLQPLLDEQTPAARRPAAVVRIREYAGLEPGYQALTEILKQRVLERMAKPNMVYPARVEIETEMGRNSNYRDGIAALMQKYDLKGWQEPFAKLKKQLEDYDAWVRETILPKARNDFRLPSEEYALQLESFGIDIPPDRMALRAHQAFLDLQAEMTPIAAQIARERQMPSSDYRDVIRELKKQQLVGDAILPFFDDRLKQIEKIIVDQKLVSLPERPAKIRIATAAETAQQPAPHMQAPPFLHNTGQKGVFVLPLNIPPAPGQAAAEKYDDFAYDAAAWTLTAHEARPGHELQFDSMLERGVSLARARYAFNSTNVEGWGLYSEYLVKPFMPPEGQLISLDYRLLRAARAFLDPELQTGKIQPEEAYRVLEQDVVTSHAFAQEEVERFTYRMPGQASSYFYGYTRLIELRQDVEKALGSKFQQKAFHDFLLGQGLLPPDLMRQAVMEEFVPSQRAPGAPSAN